MPDMMLPQDNSTPAALSLPPQVVHCINRLEAYHHAAYVVGGCVRDSLLGHTPHDWDLTTDALPEQIKACFHGYRTIDTGIKHGTVTVLVDHMPLEITTFRIDGNYTDSRRPDSVTFTRSLREDLARRDFTIGAMAYHPVQGLMDPFGGRADLQAKKIRCVGEPARRFSEDALRILRAFRFAAQLDFEIEENTLRAAAECRHLIGKIAAERVAGELSRLLLAARPAKALACMYQYGVFEVVAPALSAVIPDERYFFALDRSSANLPVRLALLLRCHTPEAGEKFLHTLKFDGQTTRRVVKILAEIASPLALAARDMRHLLARCGPDLAASVLDVLVADGRVDSRAPGLLREVLDAGVCYQMKDLAVGGRDLAKIGIPPSEKTGRMLQALLESVLEDPALNTRERLMALAAQKYREWQ